MAIGEFLAYDLPLDYYNSQDEASTAIVTVIHNVLNNDLIQQYSTLTPNIYVNLPVQQTLNQVDRDGVRPALPFTEEQRQNRTPIQAMKFLVIISYYPLTPELETETQLSPTYLVAVKKEQQQVHLLGKL